MKRWPLFTILITLVLVCNPFGIAIISSAVMQSPTDWFAEFWAYVVTGAVTVLLMLGFIEWRIRRKKYAVRHR